jgi:hypothetical protein
MHISMSNRSRWLYISIILVPALAVFGLALQNHLFLRAGSAINSFDLGYEQGFGDGYQQGYTSHIEYRDVIQYVDREVIKEVIVNKPVRLREFSSLEELRVWLAEDDTDEYVYLWAGADGICQPSDKYDCDDYAIQLQYKAAESGFLISAIIIQEQGETHMINMACIANDIYYIEPQTDKVWFYCHKD